MQKWILYDVSIKSYNMLNVLIMYDQNSFAEI